MFNLKNSIKQWLNELRKYSSFEDGDIAEIEDHIRDEIDSEIHLGNSEEKAFKKAITSFGSREEVGKEMYFAKSRIKNYKPEILKQEFPNSGNPILMHIMMLQNNVKVALRNFLKNKVYGTINLTGLVIGMVSCLIISLYVFQELSYDRFHEDSDHIFRIHMDRY
ncbi:MAG: permease prefix domain 1-containing protein, partial [Bacteroidetes bacterium]|nr:permease prefix domain 1-containing protein [Bacteroidota bacterium]